MDFVVLIPARGGSKRFPKKNISILSGKPLIVHSIDYVKKIDPNLKVFVSTDNEDISNISRQNGAVVIERPDNLSNDLSPTRMTVQHTAEYLINQNIDFDYIILLQPTNPLRPSNLLLKSMEIIDSQKFDSLISVSPSFQKLGRIVDDKFVPFNYSFGQRSQDMEPLYFENGLIYITKKEVALSGRLIGDLLFPLIVDHIFSKIDIDTYDDLLFAESILNSFHESS